MQFDVDDKLGALLDELDEWATAQVHHAEQEALKLDVSPTFLTPQDFWAQSEGIDTESEIRAFLGSALELLSDNSHTESKDDVEEPQLQILTARLEACEMLLKHIGHALEDLDKIDAQHRLVSDKTHSLHEVCKRLLAEQTRLDKVVAGIQGPMTYFVSYDEIAPRFGVKTENADPRIKQRVLHPDDAQFKRDLARLDECVAFLDTHPHYRDHNTYLTKFRALQLQAMSMILAWVIEEITRLADSAQTHLKPAVGSTASFLDNAYLYNRFAERGKILRPSIIELEKRPAISGPALRETLSKYCSLRRRLLQTWVLSSPEVQSRDPALVSRILLGAAFLGKICSAEYSLLTNFFSLSAAKVVLAQLAQDEESDRPALERGRHGLDDGDDDTHQDLGNSALLNPFADEMEALCSCMYESLRPVVIKETDLEKLCDASSAIESAIQDLDARMDRDAVEPLERVLARVALDIQERLVFCAVRVIRDNVVGFSIPESVLTSPSGNSNPDTWYPTLEVTLSTLSKVYRCVEPAVFEHLATEAVAACTRSLCDAARIISKRVSPDDADLFLVKHLLILREQISPFRAALSVKETRLDFGSTSRALRQLFARTSSGQGGRRGDWMTLIRFAGPTAHESDFDTKKELDAELRKASESFILRVSKRALGPLLEFVDASQAYLQQEAATWEGLTAQNFASKESVEAAVAHCEKQTIAQVQAAKDKATQYLANAQTRSVLFNAVEANAFKVVNSAANFSLDLFKEDVALNERLRELVRQVAGMRAVAAAPSSPTPSTASRTQSPRVE